MACQGQILEYILVFAMAVLLTKILDVETLVSEASLPLQVNHLDEPLHHIGKRNAAVQVLNVSNITTVTPVTMTTITTATTTTSSTTITTTTEMPTTVTTPPPAAIIQMSIRINQTFDTSLTNKNETKYKFYAANIESAVDKSYSTLPDYIQGSAKVIGFRSGNITADYTIKATSSDLNLTSANTQVSEALLEVGIPLTKAAFIQNEERNLTSRDKLFPQQSMQLRCTRPDSVEGTIKWTVNDKDLVQNSVKYTIINDGSGSTLIVKNASESDNGVYSCIIERTALPFGQWQNIVLEPRPNIRVDNPDSITFQCEDQIVSLKCCLDTYPIEWDPILPGDELDYSVPGCTILKHKILKANCGSKETFMCRLKNMTDLEKFHYYKSTIRVQTDSDYDCKNETLGNGKVGKKTKGLCEEGMEGHITYQCQQVNFKYEWIPIKRNCVVKAIKDLQRRAEGLIGQFIPDFMNNLTKAAEQHNHRITQSADTVQIMVEILFKIATDSKQYFIDKDVMKNFLKTADIIVADECKNTWAELKNSNSTVNKSAELLQAIETISDHLSDDTFTLYESSIQLNRATIYKSFVTSQLSNSNTQIMIPNVVKPTLIAIIVFTNLNHVLPTHNTSNINSNISDNHINGDVVVIKVNETINNISFTFDIKNTSLKNPQCVFWNFSLNHWDSAGCKVKLLGNEADKVTCECNHTTSFSILMQLIPNAFAADQRILDHITYIGVAISIICLILCLIIEMIVLKSVTVNDTSYMRHVSIVNIAVSLLIADIWFIIGASVAEPGASTPVNPCSAAVFFIHFFYLALFFWMFILALLLFYRTVMPLSQMSRTEMLIAFTVGYCAPLLIAVITVATTAGAGRYIWTRDACWLNWFQSKALLAFVIPALTIVAFNLLVVVVIVIMCKMLKREVGADPDEKKALLVNVLCVIILTLIFGLTWGFGIGTMVSPDFAVHVVFAILNSLQGFFVLVFGTLLDRKIIESLEAAMLLLKNLISSPDRNPNAGTSTGTMFLKRMHRDVGNTSETRRFSASSSSS